MRSITALLFLALLLVDCSRKEADLTKGYSHTRTAECPYKEWNEQSYGFCSFERYMWDGGFPDTIIVKFTRNGEFIQYMEAVRYDLLEDEYGNYYSPGYIIRSYNGDSWIYDVKGKFVRFDCCIDPHAGRPHTYVP